MTPRSIIIGLVGAAILSALAFFNDMVLQNTFLIGHFFPASVFGVLAVFALVINPLLARIRRSAALSGAEIATATTILLIACAIPGRGLLQHFTNNLMLPHHHLRTRPGWQGGPVRLEPEALHDVAALMRSLDAAEAQHEGHVLRVVAERFPDALRAEIRNAASSPEAPDPALRDRVLEALREALGDPSLPVRLDAHEVVPAYVRYALSQASRSPDQVLAIHRGLFDAALPDAVVPREPGVIERVPPHLLADPSVDPAHAMDGFVTGLGTGEDGRFRMSDIPWAAWRRTFLFWIPLLLTAAVWVVAFALVLHRQWSDHEHLPYPTAAFALAMLPDRGRAIGAAFTQRIFWVGFLPVLIIHLYNYAHAWWPQILIPVSLRLDLRPLAEIITVFDGFWGTPIFDPPIYFVAVGFAYFLASDVSLSLGLSPYLYYAVFSVLTGFGISAGGGMLQPSVNASLYAGGSFALFLVVLYTGRQWLRAAFARGLGFRTAERVDPHAVWGARFFMAAFLLFILQLVRGGVSWPFALFVGLTLLMMHVVTSRMLAEAGTAFIQVLPYPSALLWTFLGAAAVGPEQLLLLGILGTFFVTVSREALMPFALTGLRIADRGGVPPGRVARWGVVAVAVAMAVGIPSALYWQYREGAFRVGHAFLSATAAAPYEVNTTVIRQLDAQGVLEASRALTGWARFSLFSLNTSLVVAFLITFGLVLLFTWFRHRFARFPLHPILFLMLATHQSRFFAFSFLLGWAIKGVVTRYGGARLYQHLKPTMIGLVGGEVTAVLLSVLIGALYYAVTENPPVTYRILPD